MYRNKKIINAQLVIMGAGLSGLAAAIEAKEQGLEKVIVLEKSHAPGGNGVFPDPMVRWDGKTVDLPMLEDKEISADDPRLSTDPCVRADAIFNATMEWNHWRADARLVRALIDETQNIYPWVEGMLLPEDIPKEPEKHKSHMHGLQIKIFIRRCKELGVEIICDTAGKRLLKNEDGNICGIIASGKDKDIEIYADHVILAAGGFLGDKELMHKYLQNYDETTADDFIYLGRTYSGDGVKMAFEAGAADDGTVAFECDPTKVPWIGARFSPVRDFFDNKAHPEFIWLNQDGERFADESVLNATNSMYRLREKKCWILFDERIKKDIINAKPPIWRPWIYYKKDMDFDQELQSYIDQGYIKKADSLDEIAKWIGAEPERLKKTLKEYNEDCESGRDRWFLKPVKGLKHIDNPPYYASICPMPMIASRGPLRVNTNMEILRKGDLKPIKGLYATGVDVGGTDSDCYAGCSASHSSQFAVASGRIAARHAAECIKESIKRS